MGVGYAPWMRGKFEQINYLIKPHYRWFPFIWFDVVKDRWWTDGTHTPMQEIKVLKSKVSKEVAIGFIKLLA